MPVSIGTLGKDVPREVKVALQRLADHANDLEQQHADLKRQVDALPTPLTLGQIQQELSATGSAPLNLTGLIGTP